VKILQDTFPEIGSEAEVYSFPCSLVQRIAWFLDRMSPATPMMNIAVRVLLDGPLQVEFLTEAFRELAARHEILRTSFSAPDGNPCQMVSSEVRFALPLIDLRERPDTERKAEAERLASEEAKIGFDIERGPLFRATLIQTASDSHVLLLTMHHMISDGWSIGIVTSEIGEIYGALVEGRRAAVPALSIQYGDYACWQRDWMASAEYQSQLRELKAKLDGFAPLVLESDYPRHAATGGVGQIRSLLLPRDLTNTLKRLSDRQGCTLFVTMFSAFATMMHKSSGQQEVVIRTQVAGRERLEVEPLIGWFVNSLVLRTQISPDQPFLALLEDVRRLVLETFDSQDVPFESLMEVLRPASSARRHPPFQVNFIFQRDLVSPWRQAGVTMTPIPSKAAGTFCDLNFFLVEREDGWRASVDVNTDVFASETGERMLQSFQKLLQFVAAGPSQLISNIPFAPVRRKLPETQKVVTPECVAARSAIESALVAIWEDVLKVSPIGVETNFFDVGGHSLLAVPILLRVKERFGLAVPLARLFANPTVEAMAKLLEKPASAALIETVPIQPSGSRHPFFMIGGDHWFRPLAKRLGPDQPFLGISLQRYEQLTEPALFESIGRDLAQLIVRVYPSGPYLLGGWCVDGCVAYEVARQLKDMGKEVGLVALMDAINPLYRRTFRSTGQSVVRILRRFSDLMRDTKGLHGKDARLYFWSGLIDIYRRVRRVFSPLRTKIEQDQLIVQSDPDRQEFRRLLYRSEDLYNPIPTDIPLLLIRSQVDRYQDPNLGWDTLALGRLETVEVSGGHIAMFREPAVESLAAVLWRRLEPIS
jgi:thioesterase domain-containing protein/acyl carrier protein